MIRTSHGGPRAVTGSLFLHPPLFAQPQGKRIEGRAELQKER
jgi:hypothetical protein